MKILKELKRLADFYGLDYDVNMEGHPAHHFQYVSYSTYRESFKSY